MAAPDVDLKSIMTYQLTGGNLSFPLKLRHLKFQHLHISPMQEHGVRSVGFTSSGPDMADLWCKSTAIYSTTQVDEVFKTPFKVRAITLSPT